VHHVFSLPVSPGDRNGGAGQGGASGLIPFCFKSIGDLQPVQRGLARSMPHFAIQA
jgi:hypothetical protein